MMKPIKMSEHQPASYWQGINSLWEEVTKHVSLSSICLLVDINDEQVIRTHGFNNLGYPNDVSFHIRKLVDFAHPDHRLLLPHLRRAMIEAFTTHASAVNIVGGFCFKGTRSYRDATHNYWLVNEIIEPIGLDVNNCIRTFLCRGHIMERYKGERLTGKFYHPDFLKNRDILWKMNQIMEESREIFVDTFHFTRLQREVFFYISSGVEKKDLMEVLELTEPAFRFHKTNIKRKIETVLNRSFETTKDAVIYLVDKRRLSQHKPRSGLS